MKKRLELKDIPELPGYMPVARVAAMYNMHKGSIYHMIYHSRAFKHVFKVSTGVEDPRPLLLLRTAEVEQVFAERAARAMGPASEKTIRDWLRRVRAWGVESGWAGGEIKTMGSPPRGLIDAYLAAHPEDPRPA